jgi:hypothetical protein
VGLFLFIWRGYRCFSAALSLGDRFEQLLSSSIWAPVCLIGFVGYLARGISYSPIAFFLFSACFVAIRVEKNQQTISS